MFIDPTGESIAIPVAGSAVIVALYAITVTGIVMVALNASGITVSFGEVLSGAISLLAEQTRMKVNSIKVLAQALVASLTISAAEKELENIARKYGKYQCLAAAKAMAKYLYEKKIDAKIVKLWYITDLKFPYLYSDSAQDVISTNGVHYGVLLNGKIYCNIHPKGLAKLEWINDFNCSRGRKIVSYFSLDYLI